MARFYEGQRVRAIKWNPLSLPHSLVGAEGTVLKIGRKRICILFSGEAKPRFLHHGDAAPVEASEIHGAQAV